MDVLERYQILLEKDPRSQVFAPLAEAYRKMGLLEEAFRICVRGVQFHPGFSGGRIALAKVLLDRENPLGALAELEKAADLSPDNILAHQLLGELHLTLKNAKAALRAYKMVLFLAPHNERAQKAVKKLEALTADEFDDDIFAMKPLRHAVEREESLELITPAHQGQSDSQKISELERYLSLADAYIVRNDFERAGETLKEAERYYSTAPELLKRIKLLQDRTRHREPPAAINQPSAAPPNNNVDQKIQLLSDILHRFQTRAQV
jgi:tetratricopeptide (TPR) repeat protein